MKVCKNCNKEYSDDCDFCEECGTKLSTYNKKELLAEPVNKKTHLHSKKDIIKNWGINLTFAVVQFCIFVWSMLTLVNVYGINQLMQVENGLIYFLIALLSLSASIVTFLRFLEDI